MLPLPGNGTPVSMGEGWTPLIAVTYSGRTIYCKSDFLNPTGSFKDRGTSVIVSAIKSMGIEDVVEDSVGKCSSIRSRGIRHFPGCAPKFLLPPMRLR